MTEATDDELRDATVAEKREWAANASLTEVHLFRVMPRGRYWGRSVCGRVRLYDEPFWSIHEDWDNARAVARDHASYRPLPVCVDCTRCAEEDTARYRARVGQIPAENERKALESRRARRRARRSET